MHHFFPVEHAPVKKSERERVERERLGHIKVFVFEILLLTTYLYLKKIEVFVFEIHSKVFDPMSGL